MTINEQVRAQLAAFKERAVALTDPDAPEVTDWTGAVRGRFYRPLKQQISIRVGADVLEWFRAQSGKYQRRINEALREYIEHHSKHP